MQVTGSRGRNCWLAGKHIGRAFNAAKLLADGGPLGRNDSYFLADGPRVRDRDREYPVTEAPLCRPGHGVENGAGTSCGSQLVGRRRGGKNRTGLVRVSGEALTLMGGTSGIVCRTSRRPLISALRGAPAPQRFCSGERASRPVPRLQNRRPLWLS